MTETIKDRSTHLDRAIKNAQRAFFDAKEFGRTEDEYNLIENAINQLAQVKESWDADVGEVLSPYDERIEALKDLTAGLKHDVPDDDPLTIWKRVRELEQVVDKLERDRSIEFNTEREMLERVDAQDVRLNTLEGKFDSLEQCIKRFADDVCSMRRPE